jgi:hypothetical protein
VSEAKEQPLGVPDTGEVGAVEAPRIEAAATDASTSAFHLGALLAGLLMILGGIASGIGIRNPRREVGNGEDGEGARLGEPADRSAPGGPRAARPAPRRTPATRRP